RTRGVHRTGVLDLAVGTNGCVPGIANFDRRADPQGTSDARQFAAAALTPRVSARELPLRADVSSTCDFSTREISMSPTDSATYERLEKDVTAVKNDIAALTDQITDVLNSFANSAGKQARRGYKQARENMDSSFDDLSERGSAMMGAAQDAYGSIEESLEDAIKKR